MIPLERYLDEILARVEPMPPLELPVGQCLGLTLAEDVSARLDVPRFANSAMDGFAVRSCDLPDSVELAEGDHAVPTTLPVAGDIPAGDSTPHVCAPGSAWRIMTGARMPAGADTVVKVEDTTLPAGPLPLPEQVTITCLPRAGANVRHAGEDARVGDVVLRAGTVLTPAALSSAVSIGASTVSVHPRITAAVVSTGDELAAPGAALDDAQIPDSNSLLLAALLTRCDVDVRTQTHCPDDPQRYGELVTELARDHDLIVTSGGVSAGAYDVVKMAGSSFDIIFEKVAMQPGKPQGFARIDTPAGQAYLAALPGNPVSVFVSFHLLVRPLLAALSGQDLRRVHTHRVATASRGWRSPLGRRQFVPVHLEEATRPGDTPIAHPTHELGSRSHFAASLHAATGLAVIAEEVDRVEPWSIIDVITV